MRNTMDLGVPPGDLGVHLPGRGGSTTGAALQAAPTGDPAIVWRNQWRLLLACFAVSGAVTVVSHLVKVRMATGGLFRRVAQERVGGGWRAWGVCASAALPLVRGLFRGRSRPGELASGRPHAP